MDNGKWAQAQLEANGGMPDLPMPNSPEQENEKAALSDSVEALYDAAEKNGINKSVIDKMLGSSSLNGLQNEGISDTDARLGNLNEISINERAAAGFSPNQTADTIAKGINQIDQFSSDEPTTEEKESLVELQDNTSKDRKDAIKNKKHQMDSYLDEAESINKEAEKSGDIHKQLVATALLKEKVLREQKNKILGLEN